MVEANVNWTSPTTAAQVFTPIAAIFTAVCYAAGFAAKATALQEFGIASNTVSNSFQDTVVYGFVPVISGAIFIALLGSIIHAVNKTFPWIKDVVKILISPPRRKSGKDYTVVRLAHNLNKSTFFVLILYLVSAYGLLVGGLAGIYKAHTIKQRIANGCLQECFSYVFANRMVEGVLVVQDDKSLFISTSQGVRVLAKEKLLLISRYSPSQKQVKNSKSSARASTTVDRSLATRPSSSLTALSEETSRSPSAGR